MGNSNKTFNQNFLNDWVQIETDNHPDKIIWAKKNDRNLQMEQYNLNVTSKDELEEEEAVHAMRQNHPQLVSSLHFKDETEEEFCASNYKGI